MRLGLDVFLEDISGYKGKRIALVTNMTGVNQKLVPIIDLFYEHPDILLTALFAPEHGIRGHAREGEKFDTFTDSKTNLPVYSLYGKDKKPSKEMMEQVDVVVFDLQDIGSRYYTFIYTMAYVMEACRDYGKEFVVLDRPNPINGMDIEGNLVEEGYRSFVGLYPIPNRHGMTVGELAQLFNKEYKIECDLTVIPMHNWERHMYFEDTNLLWVPPSPNTTTIDMTVLYPGTCLIEGTNLSEGRGTTKPFEYIGAPFIDGVLLAKRLNDLDLLGVLARPTSFIPTASKYEKEVCEGVQLHIVNRGIYNSFHTGVKVIETIQSIYKHEFEFIQHTNGKYFFDLLAGTDQLRKSILNGNTEDFLKASFSQLNDFKKTRDRYLIYK